MPRAVEARNRFSRAAFDPKGWVAVSGTVSYDECIGVEHMGRDKSGIVEELKQRLQELLGAIGEALAPRPALVPVPVKPRRR